MYREPLTVASLYNSIATFEEQVHNVNQSILLDLADLFHRYDMHGDFGLCLLHRHHTLQPNHVMVHTKTPDGLDICEAEELGFRDIHPCAFIVSSQDEFTAFEFEASSMPSCVSPTRAFLAELASFLRKTGHHRILGLVRLSQSRLPWNETLLLNGRGTIARQASEEKPVLAGVVTEWAFSVVNGEISVTAMKGCDEPPSGGHKSN